MYKLNTFFHLNESGAAFSPLLGGQSGRWRGVGFIADICRALTVCQVRDTTVSEAGRALGCRGEVGSEREGG